MNFFQLMVIISISILVVLVGMLVFCIFFFQPLVPLIILAIAAVSSTVYAQHASGMADGFCFHKDTRIVMNDGSLKPIEKIVIGDILKNNSVVSATMKFTGANVELWIVDGIIVSGTHRIYINGSPYMVKDSGVGVKISDKTDTIYCLNTSDHLIHVKGTNTILKFSDWEEIESEALAEWDNFVRDFLNDDGRDSGGNTSPDPDVLESESGFHPDTIIVLNDDSCVSISNLSIGDEIKDGDKFTKVLGIVEIDSSELKSYGSCPNFEGSGSVWVKHNNSWIRSSEIDTWSSLPSLVPDKIINIFTESGKFSVRDLVVRDFSDIGIKQIHNTYEFTYSKMSNYF
jgi:hypothetical protein